MRSRRRVAPDGLQPNSLATEQGVSKYVSGNLSRNTERNRRSLISGLSLDLLVSAFPLVGAPTKCLIKKICFWVLAIRDCRAASCLRIRDGKFRAAAVLAPRGRRNHQAPLEDMEAVSSSHRSLRSSAIPPFLRQSLRECRPLQVRSGRRGVARAAAR